MNFGANNICTEDSRDYLTNRLYALTDMLDNVVWRQTERYDSEDILLSMYIEGGGRITVLDCMTGYGYGIRDIESGYRDEKGLFWLASGRFDITRRHNITVAEAIQIIKENSNTCTGH